MLDAYKNGRFITFAWMGLCFPTRTFHIFATNAAADNAMSYENCVTCDSSGTLIEMRKQNRSLDKPDRTCKFRWLSNRDGAVP